MKKYLAAFLVLLVCLGQAQACDTNCCRYPIRNYGAGKVDFRYVFKQWPNYKSTNQTAWCHIEGIILPSENYGGWVVKANVSQVGTNFSREMTIWLKHPPVAEMREFDRLDQLRIESYAAMQSAQFQASAARSDVEEYSARARSVNDVRNGSAYQNKKLEGTFNALDNKQSQSRAKVDSSLAASRENYGGFQYAIEQLKYYTHSGNQYMAHLFAYRTGEVFHGMPVFETGF